MKQVVVLGLVAWAVLAAGCGASNKTLCGESMSARAAGKYEGQTPEAAAKARSDYAYACATVCYDEYETDSPTCGERAMLVAADDLLNPRDEQSSSASEPVASAPAPAPGPVRYVAEYVEELKRDASAEGYAVALDVHVLVRSHAAN